MSDNKEKIYIFLVAFVIGVLFFTAIHLTSATNFIPSIAPVKLDSCANLLQNNNGTYANITSIVAQDGSYVLSSGSYSMTKFQNSYNFTFCNNSILGTNIVCGFDDDSGNWCYSYLVTANGQDNSITQGIIYLGMLILVVSVFIFLLFSFVRIPYQNNISTDGVLLNINYKKYLKIGLFFALYVCFVAISYFAWNLSFGILQFNEMANFFHVLYQISFSGLFLVLPCSFVFAVVALIKDKKWEKYLDRGLTVKNG